MNVLGLEQVSAAALALDTEQRAELASILLASLGAPLTDETVEEFDAKIARRIVEIEAGTATLLTPAEVDARIRARLNRG